MPTFWIDPEYEDLYSRFKKHIEPRIEHGKLTSTYRFQMTGLKNKDIIEHVESVFKVQKTAFKLLISCSYILENIETGELSFYWATRNNQKLFEESHFIGRLDDVKNLGDKIKHIDLKAHVAYPNSKYVFRRMTNVVLYVTRLPNVPIGSTCALPPYLLNNKGLKTLARSYQTGQPFDDDLCFFRCLALHRGANIRSLERPTKDLFREFLQKFPMDETDFKGVSLGNIQDAANIFNVGINVYSLDSDGAAELVLRTTQNHNTMSLNLHEKHFSYISDFNKFSSSYLCPSCKKSFNRRNNCERHKTNCDASTKSVYGSGVYKPPMTIFERLPLHGIHIPSSLQFYEHKIVFDIECTLDSDTQQADTVRTNYTHRHELASVSMCSNIDQYEEPVCYISDGCPKELMSRCLGYMVEMATAAKELQRDKFSEFIPQIEELDDERLVESFDDYLSQVPVLSFFGSSYDLRICKEPLISLLLESAEIKKVIKRGGKYTCLATDSLLFLDVVSYLAAGTSLDGFLKAFGATQTKGYFPYEYFTSLDILDSAVFPPYEAFYSSIKMRNTLEPTANESISEVESGFIGRVPTRDNPLTKQEIVAIGHHRYNVVEETFMSNCWTMREYLEDYNNR